MFTVSGIQDASFWFGLGQESTPDKFLPVVTVERASPHFTT
jgi:hypothetical protein